MQIEWRKLLGTGSFSRMNTAARPLAAGAAPRDSNFEDAVTSFVYTSRMPFHPERLYKFVTEHFNLHERDWGEDMAQQASDALVTIQQAAAAIAVSSKMLPKTIASVKRAADTAVAAALAAAAEAEAAGPIAPPLFPVGKKAARSPASAGKRPFGRILRSKGQVWLPGEARHDHMGDWSLAGDVLQFTTGGPWIAKLPLKLWPQDESKRAEIMKDLVAGIGDRCAALGCLHAQVLNERLLLYCTCSPASWFVVGRAQSHVSLCEHTLERCKPNGE